MTFKKSKKEILKGLSLYFNPGEMIGIMGPSGSGKTTFYYNCDGKKEDRNNFCKCSSNDYIINHS